MNNRVLPTFLLPILLIGGCSAKEGAHKPVPSAPAISSDQRAMRATKCIASFPDSTESIIIFDVEQNSQHKSVFKEIVLGDQSPQQSASTDGPMTFLQLRSEIRKSEPKTWAWGGSSFSRFTGNQGGIGVGRYSASWIWLCNGSTAGVRDKLEDLARTKGSGISIRNEGGVILFLMPEPFNQSNERIETSIAFPNDNSVCAASNPDVCATIARRLGETRPVLQERWQDLIKPKFLSAPFILARTYDPEQADDYYSPIHYIKPHAWKQHGIESIVLVLHDATAPSFSISCSTRDSATAIKFYKMRHYPDSSWTWDTNDDDGGFSGTIRSMPTDDPMSVSRSIFVTFGLNIFI